MNDIVVVDTDVVSFLFKDDTRRALYESYLADNYAVISFMTVAELYLWPESRNWGERRTGLLEECIQSFTVQEASPDLCRLWAITTAQAAHNGRPIDPADAWIAATALAWEVPLITHNGRHYEGVDDLTVICEA